MTNWKSKYDRIQNTSKLVEVCRTNDEQLIEKLTDTATHARYIANNIEDIGEKVDGGRTISTTMIRKILFANTGGEKVSGCHVIYALERLSANDIYVDHSIKPMTVYFPNVTISKINSPSPEREDSEQQGLKSYADSSDEDSIVYTGTLTDEQSGETWVISDC